MPGAERGQAKLAIGLNTLLNLVCPSFFDVAAFRTLYNRPMDVRLKLESILRRLELSRRELELQPEYFQATAELEHATGEISEILEMLGPSFSGQANMTAATPTLKG